MKPFTRVSAANQTLGYRLEVEPAVFFFGTRFLPREDLRALYPEYEFAFVKQVHGRAVVEADSSRDAEADAHFTNRATLAVAVQTADCVPVLLASRYRVAAVHAGWRGLAQNILKETAKLFADDPVLACAVGPHIQRASFEVGRDVAAELARAAPDPALAHAWIVQGANPERVHFDLHALALAQLRASLGATVPVFSLDYDTKSDPDFSSYRRDGTGGRQFSFVVLNS